MTDIAIELWKTARPWFQNQFRFWPDHEDMIWAKAIWPTFLGCGLFSDGGEEAEVWTRRNITALAILYAGSASAFGTPDYQVHEHFTVQWMSFSFGSKANLDATLDEVGQAICLAYPENETCVGDPGFFLPLIRSLVCGSGHYREGNDLEAYLSRVASRDFEQCEFRENALRRMWMRGGFASEELGCLL